MLKKLLIQNYAIIDKIEVDFSGHLNVITGETGAGKSILMGALSLILGERADTTVLLNKEKKCSIEGYFNSKKNKSTKKFFEENELDEEDTILIRREISPQGKSRAFINDTPVNLHQLKKMGSLLVDLHQQFDTLELGDTDFQREVLDALADNKECMHQYVQVYQQYLLAQKELGILQLRESEANKELDYNRFLFDELEEADLKENELEELDMELKRLSNAEEIKQQLDDVYLQLENSEQPIVQQIKILANKLSALAEFDKNIPHLVQRLQSTQIELQDVSEELQRINEAVQYHPEKIQFINEKIAIGYKLLKKHHVTSTNELIQIKKILQQKLDAVLNIADEISSKAKAVQSLHEECKRLAQTLSDKRKEVVPPLIKKVNELLIRVGMPNARFNVAIVDAGSLQLTGKDKIDFLFDANKSNRFEPLRKVASGGELSRLMLCIKSLLAKKLQLPTLIFDEIDTGISGEAAKQVGNIMQELSDTHQLITITHQPQIAAKATAHYFVYKAVNADKVVTSIRLLNNKERIHHIAQMMSGEKPTNAALQNAREMLSTE